MTKRVAKGTSPSRRATSGRAFVVRSAEGAVGRRASGRFSDVKAAQSAFVEKASKQSKRS